MAYTNAWDETTPLGTENASTADDYLRTHRLDLGERLEDMFYGFNAASNAAPENDYGVKFLKFYQQTSDPTSATDYGHFYVKLVDGIPEIFYQDDTNTTLQLTSGGDLYSSAGLGVAGASALVGNVAITGTLDVTGNIDPTSYETTNGGFLDTDAFTEDSATAVASQQSIKALVAAQSLAVRAFGASTVQDDDSATMLKAHAYLANQDGFVVVQHTVNGSVDVKGYVDTDSNPASGGTVAGRLKISTYTSTNDVHTFGFPVASGKYFEITSANGTQAIRWYPIGTLVKCTDQD